MITWEQIVAERPRLADTLYVARHIERRAPGFCANKVWYSTLKRYVLENVGWTSKPRCIGHIRPIGDIVNNRPIEHSAECRAAWARQEWLLTSEAYDLAYATIYEALPDCQHDEGLCG